MTNRLFFTSPAHEKSVSRSRSRRALGLLAGLALGSVASPLLAATSGANGSHDPSRMLESDGKVYIYSTGGGGKSSTDGLVWANDTTPPWNTSYVSNNQRIWAPDGIYLNGKFLLYGSLWSDTGKTSAIVLLSTPSLNPAKAKWSDDGVAIAGPSGVTHSCIDAGPVLDADGNLWVVWGGGYPFDSGANSIFVTRMDNATGKPLTTDPGYKPPNNPGYALKQGHMEGPYIHYHDGAYYLFYQTGNCCGTSNAYVMHVAKATKITGPYSGDKVFYSSGGGVTGPGHMGIYSACGVERFTYHYIPASGQSIVGENELTWSGGWPVVGASSTTPLKLCGSTDGGGGGGMGGSAGAGGSTGNSKDGGAAGGTMMGSGGGSNTDAGNGDPTTGSGGATGRGGMEASGGSSGSGGDGVTGSGGSDGSGGSTATGTGGDPVGASGSGGSGTSGAGGQSGSQATPAPAPAAEAGCACEIRGEQASSNWRGLWVLGAAIAVGARRRFSKTRS